LSRNGNQYRFLHKSLLEYLVARSIFEAHTDEALRETAAQTPHARSDSVSSRASFESVANEEQGFDTGQRLLNSVLARKNLVKDPSIIDFLVERVQQTSKLKPPLRDLIERSKTDPEVRKAAANAITILVKAGVQFNSADLKGIRIPGADLSYGVFDH